MKKKKPLVDAATIASFETNKTLKDIIIYGTKKGGDKRHFVFLDQNKKEDERTFNQSMKEILSLGTYYYLQGLDGKKKIAIIAENSYEWVIAYYSTLFGGNISVPMDLKLDDSDLVSQLTRCGCDALVYTNKTAHTAQAAKDDPECPVKYYFCISDFPQYKAEGWAAYEAGDHRCEDAVVLPEDLACVVYTSGTTGLSKGVMLTHKNITADVVASCSVNFGRQAIGFLPLNHTFCWVGALFSGYLLAEWGYICDSLKDIQHDMQKYHPQNFSAVPLVVSTIYDKIWKTARRTGKEEVLKKGLKISKGLMKVGIDKRRTLFKTIIDNLGGELELIICGGANLDPKYENGMYDFGIQILNGYGMTECSPAITVNRVDDFKLGSVGKPIPCCKIRIVDPDEFGVGEIQVKGDNVMLGYYNDPEETAKVFTEDGWLKTGDFGRIDKDGFLFYIGREKNLIILSNGKNVSPEEIEDKLMCIDCVAEVLCYQEDDHITAEFFLNEEDYPSARELIKGEVRRVNSTLPTFKQVTRTKIRDTEFPKTNTMKIVRKNMSK